MTAHLSQPQLSIQASSFPKLSSTRAKSAASSGLRKRNASLLGLLQSRVGFEMSGQNSSRQSMIPFGYIFPNEAPPSEPLLNVEENGFLAQFYQQQHPQHQPQTSTQQRTHSQSHTRTSTHTHTRTHSHTQCQTQTHSPGVSYPGLDRLEDSGTSTPNLDWLINEPPPTIHDISTASIPATTLNQQRHGQLSMSELDMNMHHDIIRAAALLSHSLQASVQPPIQPIHDHTGLSSNSFGLTHSPAQSLLPQHLFPSSAAQESSNASTIEPVHTDDALAGIDSSTNLNDVQITQRSGLLNALIPRIDTSSSTLGAVPVSHQSGSYTAPLLNRIHRAPNPRLYHFGSDKHFDNNGYRPSSGFERTDHHAHLSSSESRSVKPINQTPEMSREPSSSSSTRKHSELFSKTVASLNRIMHKRKISDESGSSLLEDDEARGTGARKRARRASAPGSSRSKRENLTNQQKRQNHIASEQKRRAQIKQGYDELNQIVPELRDGGLSKSGMLTETCNFLEQLMEANEKLRQRLGLSNLT